MSRITKQQHEIQLQQIKRKSFTHQKKLFDVITLVHIKLR